MTLKLMNQFKIQYKINETDARIEILVESSHYEFPESLSIEPDASTAAYDALLAAVHGFEVEIMNITQDSIQGEFQFINQLERLGVNVKYCENSVIIKGNGNPDDIYHPCDEIIDMSKSTDSFIALSIVLAFRTNVPVEIIGIEN